MKKTTIILTLLVLCGTNAFAQTRQKAVSKAPVKKVAGVSKKTTPSKKQEKPLSRLFWVYKNNRWVKYNGHAINLGQFWKEIGVTGRSYTNSPNCGKKGMENDCLTAIGYKLFTDEPQWAMMEDTTNIKSLVREFNIEKFMSSWEFEFYLKSGIENGSLYDAFLLQTLGAPSRRTSYAGKSSSSEVWNYDQHNLSITLKNGIATSFVKSD